MRFFWIFLLFSPLQASCLFTQNGTPQWQFLPVSDGGPAATASYPLQFLLFYTPGTQTSLTLPVANTRVQTPWVTPTPKLQVFQHPAPGGIPITLTPYLDAACTLQDSPNPTQWTVLTDSHGIASFDQISWPQHAENHPYFLLASGPQLQPACSGSLQFEPQSPLTVPTTSIGALWTQDQNTPVPIDYQDGGSFSATSQCEAGQPPPGGGTVQGCQCQGAQCTVTYTPSLNQTAGSTVSFPITLLDGSSSATTQLVSTFYDWKAPLFSLVQRDLQRTQPITPLLSLPLSLAVIPLPQTGSTLGGPLLNSTTQPKWAGGVLSPQGKIYGIPAFETRLLEISLPLSPTTPHIQYEVISGTSLSSAPTNPLWFGGVLAGDGTVYGLPHDNQVMTGASFFTLSTTSAGASPQLGGGNLNMRNSTIQGWLGGVFVPVSQTLVLVPFLSNKILQYQLSGSYFSPDITLDTAFGYAPHFSGAVYAPNGQIYFIPAASLFPGVLNLQNGSTPFSPVGQAPLSNPSSHRQWSGGVLAGNGNIYALPDCADSVLVIRPSGAIQATDQYDLLIPQTFSFTPQQCQKYQGGAVGKDGRIYAFPSAFGNVISGGNTVDAILVIEPATDSLSWLPMPVMPSPTTQNRWIGAVSTPEGSIVAIPGTASQILSLQFLDTTPGWNPNTPLSPYWNKY